MESFEKIIEVISKESKKPQDEIKKLIEEKRDELSGLVSDEGAAYIVGRELGVSLLKDGKRKLKVKNLVAGMQAVEVCGRITNVSEIREFEREGRKGRVVNISLGDDTGVVRMPLWNNEVDLLTSLEIKEGDVVSLTGCWVKMDSRGSPELRLGRGKIEKSDEKIEVPEREEMNKFTQAERTDLKNIKEGGFVEARGCLVQVYKKDPFFEICPECSARVFEEDGKHKCKEHGIVKPEFQIVVSGVMDDGTGSARVVFFRELAEQIFGENVKGLKQIAKRGKDVLSIYDHFKIMGKDFVVRGRVKKNDYTESLEIVVNELKEVDVKKESDLLMTELKNN